MQRTGPALLSSAGAVGGETEQLQDRRHGDRCSDGDKIDGGLRSTGFGFRCLFVLGLSRQLTSLACFGQLAVAFVEDLLFAAFEFVLGRDITGGAVQADVVVMLDVIEDKATGVVERERHLDADAFALEGFVPAFDFSVGLRVIGRGLHVGHAGDADELLEIFGDELGAVVADDAWLDVRVQFAGALDNGLHVRFLHFFADFMMDDEAAVAVENGAKEVEGAGDIEVAEIDVPLLMSLERLDEACAFFADGGRRSGQQPLGFKNPVNAGRAASDFVGVEHHEGETTVAFERVGAGEGTDTQLFVVGEPVVTRNPGVVFVDLPEAQFPIMELAGSDADPRKEATDGDLRLVAPVPDEIDDGVTGVVGDPAAGQLSPRLFFSRTCSSISSESTESLRCSLASS